MPRDARDAMPSDFIPLIRAWRRHEERLAECAAPGRLRLGLVRDRGHASRFEVGVLPLDHPDFGASAALAERVAKFLLWSRGAASLHCAVSGAGAERIARRLRHAYAPGGARSFDAALFERAFGVPFEVSMVDEAALPEEREAASRVGGHLDGCRLGFDLGASDYKVAALLDGEVVFSEEAPWDPKGASDPRYHIDHVRRALQRAAAHLPRVDAIGGSAAGIYVDDRPRVASLFRAVPEDRFAAEIEPMFVRLGAEWGVPIRVINDGDVAALAGSMALERGALLGVAMGSSEAAGYIDREHRIVGWLNELGFAPVDDAAAAPVDQWSGDRGVGASYFSQRAVIRRAGAAGIKLDPAAAAREQLVAVQELVEAGDPRAGTVFAAIGADLGRTLPWYRLFYDFDTVLVVGRVTSGAGGELLHRAAVEGLAAESPEVAEQVEIRLPDETTRRVGQAVAAASLPVVAR